MNEFDVPSLSRIHLKLKYSELNSDTKGEVWTNLLTTRGCTSYGTSSISARELKRLGNTYLNGTFPRLGYCSQI